MTTVTTPSPSWNPKPTPYTQPRYRFSQRSSTWRRTVGSRRPPRRRSAAIPATASSASAAAASRGPAAPDSAAPSQTHQPADERAGTDGSDPEPGHRDPPSRVAARLTEPGDAAQHRLSSGRPRRPHAGRDRKADAGHDDGIGGQSPASTCAEYRLAWSAPMPADAQVALHPVAVALGLGLVVHRVAQQRGDLRPRLGGALALDRPGARRRAARSTGRAGRGSPPRPATT